MTNEINDAEVLEDFIRAAERDWPAKIPDVTVEQLPETTMAIRAHNLLADKIQLADEIASECVRLGMTGEVTKENYSKAKTIVRLCVEARGNIKKNKEAANRDAIDWQKAINNRAKELTAAIESIEEPYKAGIKAIDAEKERLRLAKEEAERQAIIDAENQRLEAERIKEAEQRRAEAEANRKEQERLMADRKALEDERKRLADEQAEKDRIAKEERDKLNAELQKKLDAERAAFELERKQANDAKLANEKRIRAELEDQQRVRDENNRRTKAEMDKITAELAEFRATKAREEAEKKAAAEAEAKRIAKEAADKAEAERLARIAPDAEKLHEFGKKIETMAYETEHGSNAPEVVSDEAKSILQRAVMDLHGIAADLLRFGMQAH